MTAWNRHAEKQKKTEKNTKKVKNLLFCTYRPKGPKEREKMAARIDKAYVTRRAKKLNCEIEEIGGDIILTAPSGYKLYSETHYSGWELAHYSKAEIWEDFADQLTRLYPCECGC